MTTKFRIGISACFFHADPQRALFKGKPLLYLEESFVHYAMSLGGIAYLIPTISKSPVAPQVSDIVSDIDGLLLHGGADVSPLTYGEEAISPEWNGDIVRDQYEIALIRECIKQNKPIFGICRGHQILNVALGGSLYQDISTQIPHSFQHRNWEIYDHNFHHISIQEGSYLASLYPGLKEACINSVHHQAIKTLGENLVAESFGLDDKVMESIKLKQTNELDPYCLGVQWHPEFQTPEQSDLLDPMPLIADFYRAMEIRKK